MTTILDLNTVIFSFIGLLDRLTAIEQEKRKAVASNDLDALNTCIKNEQVETLKLKGLDKKREQIQTDLGYQNLTYKEIIALLPEEEKNKSRALYATLQQKTTEFQAINASVKTALDVNLHTINAELSKLNRNPDDDGTQPPEGNNLKHKFA